MTKEGVSGDSASLLKVSLMVGWRKMLMVGLLWFCVSHGFLIYIQEMFTELAGDKIMGSSEVVSSRGGVFTYLPFEPGVTRKFQTVKNGVQKNLNKGKVSIGNTGTGVSYTPTSDHESTEFQTAEDGNQDNENCSDVELWNSG